MTIPLEKDPAPDDTAPDPPPSRRLPPEPIAIVGIGCRFPRGDGPRAFWRTLADGVDAVSEVPADRWSVRSFYDPDPEKPGKILSRWGAFLAHVDRFDARFFGISPREAARMDPQQRLLLEVAWEALEDAGQPREKVEGSATGVFVGVSCRDYYELQIGGPEGRASIDGHTATGGAISIVANRVSYAFDLRGPSLAVDTACSSSLVAVHLACRSLWNGESSMALAGGVNVMVSPPFFVCLSKLAMLSPDGRCKAFDARADGYVRGEGAGMVVLKPLARARAAGDPIYAVIRGSAVNQDGRTAGITVPASAAQEAALRQACRVAGVAPERVQYVEAHGTGTPVGDPLEAGALGRVLGNGRRRAACRLGSVKTNIGHLESAAGIAGLIKVALALRHRRIPRNLHFEKPNPEIPFADLKLSVVTESEPWPADGGGRLAGVNSFGFGGTNAHVVLGDPPVDQLPPAPEAAETQLVERLAPRALLLALSAQRAAALDSLAAAWLAEPEDGPSLADLAYSAATRRTQMDHRLAAVAKTKEELRGHLQAFVRGETRPGLARGRRAAAPRPVFVFCGQGPQWWAMGRELLATEPVFRQTVERCAAAIPGSAAWSLLDELSAGEAESRLERTELLQPAIFALQVALAALWRSWGVAPAAVVGHSMGEVAAAHVAGALTLDDAVRVIYHRARLQQQSQPGRMMAVHLSRAEVEPALARHGGRLWVAGVNGPAALTLAGEVEAIEELAESFRGDGVFCRVLRVACACHGPHMEDHRDELLAVLAGLEARPPELPIYSTVSGERVEDASFGADYWWTNFRRPVLFASAVSRLVADGYRTFVELGPHPVLSTYLKETAGASGAEVTALPSLRRQEDERATLLGSLGALWCAGQAVRWERLHPPESRFVPLPSYPWQRESYWHEAEASRDDRLRPAAHPLLGRRLPAPQPSWENEIDLRLLAFLGDHSIQGTLVVPGVAYVTMALAAAAEVFGRDGACHLAGVELQKALFLRPGEAALTQLNLAPEDGSFEVWSRAGDGAWARHARGTAVHDKKGAPASDGRVDLDALRARLGPQVSGEDFYRRAAQRGIELGPAFQGVRRLWRGTGEALAEIRVPETLENDLAGYALHPAVLDACLQVSLATLGAGRPGLYLPVRVERIRVRPAPGGKLWGHARVIEENPRALVLDLRLSSAEGGEVARARGLRFQALESSPGGAAAAAVEVELYAPRWELAGPARRPAATAEPAQVARQVDEEARRLYEDLDRGRFYDSFEPQLHALCGRFVAWAFARLGWHGRVGERVSSAALQERLGIAGQHRRLLARLLGILGEEGYLAPAGGGFEVVRSWPGDEPAEAWRTLARNHSAYVAELTVLWRFVHGLPDVLRGRGDPLELLFPEGSLASSEHLYQDAPISRIYNRLVPRAVAAIRQRRPPERTLRLLEVGGGTAGMTAHLLPSLPPEGTEYVFTDVSPLFTNHARQKLRAAPFVRYELLDLEREPRQQGFAPRSFDVVVASDVLHATRDLGAALDNVATLLADGGFLLLLEATKRTRWADLVFGQMEGWWRFADFERRPDHPLLSREGWERLLEERGFTVASVSEPVAAPARCLFVASAGPVSPDFAERWVAPTLQEWLLIADRGGMGDRLARRLRELGQSCSVTAAGEEPALEGWRPRNGRVVHLRSLDGEEFETAEELREAQASGVESVLRLVRALGEAGLAGEEGSGSLRLDLVTRRTQPVGTDGDGLALAQTPVWGLARVIRHEYPGLACRTIDLDAGGEIEPLVAELFAGDGEQEVALRGGERYVERLARRPSLAVDRYRAEAGGSYRLENPTPGILDGLALVATPRRPPGPGEVEVRVAAAGLNFRDLMIAMGMLGEEALERSYGGKLLGGECAGWVEAVGQGVEGLEPGDQVIALAPASFSPLVTASAALVAVKPASLTFEEAAGLPVAGLTAYYALHRLARLRRGERLLVHSAAGGLGLAALDLARRAGAAVFATAGTGEKRQALEAFGVARAMDSRSLAFAEEVLEATGGRGVDVVINSLAGAAIRENLSILAPYGRYVEVGKADIYQDSKVGLRPFRHNLSFFALDMARLCIDQPRLIGELLREYVALFAGGELHALPHRVFPVGQAAQALRAMSKARHLGKIVLALRGESPPVTPRREGVALAGDRTYLVTGGLGGFGLLIGRWMVDAGARHLVLVGRRGAADDETRRAVAELRRPGVRVEVMAADVADGGQVGRLLAEIESSLPPLAGVVHAAMVLEDTLLAQMDDGALRRVMAPKVLGAWNLHRGTLGVALDFFVLFSSVAGLLGSAGQGNYVAANAFLDALAHHRRRLGLPALAVDWGRLGAVGYVARRREIGPLLDRQGILEFAPERALDALARMLARDPGQVAVAAIDWRRWSRANPAAAASPRFAGLAPDGDAPAAAAAPEAGGRTLALDLGSRPPDQRRAVATAALREHLARVLGTSAGELDDGESLMELGLDSLMAVELRMRIQRELGVDVPVMKLLQGPSLVQLADLVLAQLAAEPAPPEASSKAAPPSPEPPPIERAPREPPPPLSFAQERLWFLDRLLPGNPLYNVPLVLPFAGPLRRAALAAALSEIVRRHEVLRTTFREADGEVTQQIHPATETALPLVDLSRLAGPARRREARRATAEEGDRPFDLAAGPLLRCVLVRLAAGEHRLLLTLHHIVTDGWSLLVLRRELDELYEGFCHRRRASLPELGVQYADYAVWQRRWLRGEALERLLRFWRRELGDEPPVLEVPTDRPPPAARRSRGDARRLELPAGVAGPLADLARRESTTPATVLLAAFQALLGRLTGQTRLLVGAALAGRTRSEVENLIGFFVNILPMVGDLTGDPSFRRLVHRAWKRALEAQTHQELPFEKLVEELHLERRADRNPLFQVSFIFQQAPATELHSPEVTTTRFDLELHLWQRQSAITGGFTFDRDLFDATTIERLGRRLRRWVAGAVRDPDRRLSELPFLEGAEAHQIGVEWNDTASPRADGTVTELFEARAGERPDAVALATGPLRLTYGALARRARSLARRLRARGVGPEVKVAVLAGRSPELLVAFAGILRSGGAYLPLDPGAPPARLDPMLRDAAAPVLLTAAAHRSLARRLARPGLEILPIDSEAPESRGAFPAVRPEHTAYVIYTSGSTGRPKGVAVSHRSLANLVLWYREALGVGPHDRASLLMATSFDASIWEIGSHLAAGASVCFPPEDRPLAPAELLEWIAGERLTLAQFPTPLAQLVMREKLPAALALRAVLAGGDALGPVPRGLPIPLINLYGPTESCVIATFAPLETTPAAPIGRPIAGVRAHVVDSRLRPAPVGVPGELVLGGAGVARGYLRRPALTAELFVPDPYARAPAGRLYRTGDRVRLLADGNLDFLDRLDRQVKVRGFRVEPGEIEIVLGRHAAIREAAVVTRRSGAGDRRLTAYVAAPGAGLAADQVSRWLAERLPEFMVPSRVVVLDALPRTPHGKLDRAALARRASPEEAEPGEEFVAPRSPAEETLAKIWAELLDVARVGIHDDFFALGGHSLLATRMVSRLREAFAVDLPLRALFEAPTIAALARRIDSLLGRGAAPLAALPRLPRDGTALPLSFAQRRLWFLDRLAPRNPFYNIPAAFRLAGSPDVAALHGALDEIVRRHETLRTTFAVSRGEPVQVIHPPRARRWLPRVDLGRLDRARQEGEGRRLAKEEAGRPFDLERGPLLRTLLLSLRPREHLLLLTQHHIVSDGWSVGVFGRELAAIYDRLRRGEPPRLPELPVQYADYAAWQSGWLRGGLIDKQLEYWKRQLGEDPPALEMPTDRPRPAVQSFHGALSPCRLPADLAASLAGLGRGSGATLAMTLLAAFYVLLWRMTGQERILVGSPIAGRTRPEIEGLIGFFVNSLVLVGDLAGRPSLRQLLGRVRETFLAAHAHQDLPFERLVEELELDRDLSRNPLFQVAFALQNVPLERRELEDLAIEPFPFAIRATRFDLEVHLWEAPAGLDGFLSYDTALFDATTLLRLAGHYRALLAAAARDPERTISELPWLAAPERHQMLREWSGTASRAGDDATVVELFDARARRRPDALAVAAGAVHLSYGALERRAEHLADRLRRLAAGPEVPVAVLAGRSPELVTAFVAIVKAGAAYLPLDPAAPPARLAATLRDARAPILLTTDPALGATLARPGLQVFPLSLFVPSPARRPAQRPVLSERSEFTGRCAGRRAGSPAYVIYTSGTTGEPKGVAVGHRALANLVAWHHDAFDNGPDDRASLTAAVSFDASVWEIWSSLAWGSSLHVLEEGRLLAPAETWTWLARGRLTRAFLPTPLAQLALEEELPRGLRLRTLFTGGAALRPVDRELPFDLIDLYGPTESCVIATFSARRGTIGRAVRGSRAQVADRRLQPLPAGVPGELVLGGAGLARGYARRPSWTAERFVPDATATLPGERLYRTGDLVRFRADGSLEFLGRIDHQVKLRGRRVEPGEVEGVLGEHSWVREAAVVASEGSSEDLRLVAYVVPEAVISGAGGTRTDQVESWRSLFETHIYGETAVEGGDPTLNIAGWLSSYTEESLGAAAMREWLDDRLERIRGLGPGRVLEIGCGTGMLLFALAPHCREYRATDFSRAALDYVRRHAGALRHLRLFERPADDWEGIEARSCDAVILNSVVQYFPSVDYLLEVLDHAVEAVAPGGFVFVGDVRSLPLLKAFHASVELHRAAAATSRQELDSRVREALAEENELALDPAFFPALKDRLPRLEAVEVQLMRGRSVNELTRFRYDAILHVGGGGRPPCDVAWLDWRAESLSPAGLKRYLDSARPELVGLAGVPNARLSGALRTLDWLTGSEGPETAGELRDLIRAQPRGLDPALLRSLGEELGYRLDMAWSAAPESYDALLARPGATGEVPPGTLLPLVADHADRRAKRPWSSYANDPLRPRRGERLVPALRRHLLERLPEYMVPARIVVVDALPTTCRGKIDRAALARRAGARSEDRERAKPFVAPRTPVEETVAAIWRELLGIDRVGVHDDFFAAGGHSLLATRVVARLHEALGVELPVRAIFEKPTIAELARRLNEDRGASPVEDVPRLLPRHGSVFRLSFAQERLWFLDRLVPGNPFYNVPVIVPLAGPACPAALAAALHEVCRRHEALRTTFREEDGEAVQVIHPPAPSPPPVPRVDLSRLAPPSAGEEARRAEAAEGSRPFDLTAGPLARPLLFDLGQGDSHLLLTLHHIVTDGWSMEVLRRELTALYAGLRAGRRPRLPELPLQYADFAVWQRRWLRGEALESLVAFWRQELGDEPPALALPADRPRPPVQRFRGGRVIVKLPAAADGAVRALARRGSTTPATVLLASFFAVLGRLTGRDRIVVGSPVAGRHRGDVEDLIGFFVNLLPMVGDLAGNPSFRRLVDRTRERTLAAQAHQDLPFEKLLEALPRLDRRLDRHPLFQVVFAYQGRPPEGLRAPEVHTARMDLEAHVWQQDDGLRAGFVYDRDLFDAATVERLAHGFRRFLARALAQPERRLSELPVFSAAEEHALEMKRREEARRRPPDAQREPPRRELSGATEEAVVEIWRQLLGVDRVAPGDDFFALGGHSLAALRLLSRLKRAFQVELPVRALFEDATLAAIARRLEAPAEATATRRLRESLLVPLQPRGDRPPFFCIHPVMGVVFPYMELARRLGPEQPFFALQALGLHDGEEPGRCIETMSEIYLEAVRDARPRGPYRLGGWSLGGLVAFEMARRLERDGERVSHLVMLDTPVPGRNGKARWGSSLAVAGLLVKHFAPFVRDYFSLRKTNGSSTGDLPAVLPILRVTRAALAATLRYRPAGYGGELTLLRTDPTFRHAADPSLGWAPLVRSVEVRRVPGSHLSLLREPHVEALAQRLRELLSSEGSAA